MIYLPYLTESAKRS